MIYLINRSSNEVVKLVAEGKKEVDVAIVSSKSCLFRESVSF